MENTMNYDQYDAYIHGYDYHTGAPTRDNLREIETCFVNPLNSIFFIMKLKEKENENES